MDLVSLAIIAVLGIGFLIESLLLVGCIGLIREQDAKMNIVTANYKSDLEMVLLHVHSLDEFMKNASEGMKPPEHPTSRAYA